MEGVKCRKNFMVNVKNREESIGNGIKTVGMEKIYIFLIKNS